ncbi:MAG: exosome complex component RRP45 [Amphiamblys sp. WSBS2006]|nr:MAG: exosome complex component RRP45 [Amphiamblys sp. WSBS2006]
MLSLNEKAFIQQGIKEGNRTDGRGVSEHREIEIKHELIDRRGSTVCFPTSLAVCRLGKTEVKTTATLDISTPSEKRPKEGKVRFDVKILQMAAAGQGLKRKSSLEAEHLLVGEMERLYKTNRALEADALCILAGEKVWSVFVDVSVVFDDGNLVEAVSACVLTALYGARRNDFSVEDETLTIHSSYDKELVPLLLNSYPLCTAFSVFCEKEEPSSVFFVVDATRMEESVEKTRVTVGYDARSGKVVSFSKHGGEAIAASTVFDGLSRGIKRARSVYQKIKDAVLK